METKDVCPNCGREIKEGELTTGVGYNNTGTAHIHCPERAENVQSQTAGK